MGVASWGKQLVLAVAEQEIYQPDECGWHPHRTVHSVVCILWVFV
jgi:hypothetical protein